ncbi:hypothetical protein JCM18920_391 [Cutibacterium acnes JCM 18920]|nr:hypothetical protein JCM18920_391 [Cutibacterium acnes JCM 18920]
MTAVEMKQMAKEKKSACGSRIEWKALPSAENLFASAINFDAVRIPFTVACTRFIPEISPPESVDDPISAMIGIIFFGTIQYALNALLGSRVSEHRLHVWRHVFHVSVAASFFLWHCGCRHGERS